MQSPFRDLPREVSTLVAASFFVAVGFGIVMPAIPVFAKSFGVNNAAIGLMVSAFAITRFASGLNLRNVLVDKFGEREKSFLPAYSWSHAFTFLSRCCSKL
jgi:MFS family permease